MGDLSGRDLASPGLIAELRHSLGQMNPARELSTRQRPTVRVGRKSALDADPHLFHKAWGFAEIAVSVSLKAKPNPRAEWVVREIEVDVGSSDPRPLEDHLVRAYLVRQSLVRHSEPRS